MCTCLICVASVKIGYLRGVNRLCQLCNLTIVVENPELCYAKNDFLETEGVWTLVHFERCTK